MSRTPPAPDGTLRPMATPRPESEGLNLGALFGALKRGWLLIVLSVTVTTAAAAFFALRQPSIYEASSVVSIETAPDATSLAIGSGPVGESRSLLTEVERLRLSAAHHEAVARRLLGSEDTSRGEAPPDVRALAASVGGRVSVEPYGNGVDMIQITARGGDPEEVARLANVYAEVYSERGRSMNESGTASTRSFLEEQAAKQRAELEAAEADLAAFKTRAGTVDLNAAGQNAVSQVASLDAAIQDAGVELQVAQSRRASLQRELDRVQPNLVGRISSTASGEISALQGRIAALEVEASDYYARDPSLRGNEGRSPELAAINRRIQDARAQVRRLADQYVGEVRASGGADGSDGLGFVSGLQQQVAEVTINIQGLQARLNALLARRRDYASQLRDIPSQQVRVAELQRAQQAAEQSYLLLDERARQVAVAGEGDMGYVEVVRPASVPGYPVAPNRRQTVVLGLLLGLLLGVGLTLIREVTDPRVRTREALRSHGFRVIGTVPDFSGLLKKTFDKKPFVEVDGREISSIVAAGVDPYSLVTESFRHLRTTVGFSQGDRAMKTLLVTSPGPGEGKSTVALGLAVSFAQAGRRTLYVDADLRKPIAHTLLGVDRRGGLSNTLVGGGVLAWEAYRRPLHVAWRSTDYVVEGLHVMTAGDEVANPTELLGSETLGVFLEEARQAFDVVVVDTSPVLPVPDALLVAVHCDAVVLVAHAGETDVEALSLAFEALEGMGDRVPDVAGVVLNRASDRGVAGYGYGYGDKDALQKAAVPFKSGDGATVPHSAPVLGPMGSGTGRRGEEGNG